jgi:class 3 adenylate cyclase
MRRSMRSLAITALVLLGLCLGSAAYMTAQVESRAYRDKVRAGEMLVNLLAGSAKLPLLGGDTLVLHNLVEEAARAEGLLYAAILDAGQALRAKATSRAAGIVDESFEGIDRVSFGKEGETGTEVLQSGVRVLRFSRPVTFTSKTVGYAILGFSKEAIDQRVRSESRFVWPAFVALAVCMVTALGGVALVSATRRSAARRASAAGAYGNMVTALPESGLDRCQMTVVFVGVKGFKKYADAKEPAQVIRDLKGYLAVATETISAFGGEVYDFVGDAAIGVFRGTVLQPDHVERAVRSAAAIQNSLRQADDGNPLRSAIGIGVSSGVALEGQVVLGQRKEPLYIGEIFKSAYLLHAVACQGDIVISRDVYQVMQRALSVEPIAPREMLERTESWENFRIVEFRDESKAV